MKLTEIEQKCEQMNSIQKQLDGKRAELQRLEIEEKKAREDFQVQRMMAEIRGEKYEGKCELEELKKVKNEIEGFSENVARLEKEILQGLKELAIDVLPKNIPEPNSEKKVTLNFEGNPCDNAVKFITSLLSLDIPLVLDNVLLHPNKVVVTNIRDRIEVAKALQAFQVNIKRLACVALKENDPDVEEVAKHFHESPYRDIWEAIRGRKVVSNQDMYNQMNLKTSEEKKRIRNFFTNTKDALKDKYPFIRLQEGNYELNFLGLLAWKRYQDEYLKKEEIMREEKQEVPQEKPVGNDRERRPEKSTLNNFLNSDKIKETIYGKKVK